MSRHHPTKIVWVLALGGFIPFAFLAFAVFMRVELVESISALSAFTIWSLTILSFLGGIRWGLAFRESPVNINVAALSVVPCIIGWFSLALSPLVTTSVLLLLYLFHGVWDVTWLRNGPLAWFAPVRATLTSLVCLSHIVVILGLI